MLGFVTWKFIVLNHLITPWPPFVFHVSLIPKHQNDRICTGEDLTLSIARKAIFKSDAAFTAFQIVSGHMAPFVFDHIESAIPNAKSDNLIVVDDIIIH